jgi:hypothetical protein
VRGGDRGKVSKEDVPVTAFFRFPHTPHLVWLGSGRPRDDKVLQPAEALAFLADEVTVEEKVDGANLGLSVDENGEFRAQNRGRYLPLGDLSGQWKPFARWLETRKDDLADALLPNLLLFGEWCYAVHSVRYTRLPDWFLAFDVFDRDRGEFWSTARRDELAARLKIACVPSLGTGHFSLGQLQNLLTRSQLRDGPAEGIYVRREKDGRLIARAKLVRPEFVQTIDEHWSRRVLESNALSQTAKAGSWR